MLLIAYYQYWRKNFSHHSRFILRDFRKREKKGFNRFNNQQREGRREKISNISPLQMLKTQATVKARPKKGVANTKLAKLNLRKCGEDLVAIQFVAPT